MPEQNCGNCGWSEPRQESNQVDCDWAVHNKTPDSIEARTSFMYASQGIMCPCWKPKRPHHD